MLTGLHIQDFVLIDQAHLVFGDGLIALTGETGAGKSILLDALGLAAGGRADRAAIRKGAAQGVVTAIFEPLANHPVWAVLEDNALAVSDDQIILRRVQTADGRGRGFINDQPVSIGMLKRIGETLLEIHGQQDGRGFLTASAHRSMLDEFAGIKKDVKDTAQKWQQWRAVEVELDEKRRERDVNAREADYLRHVFETLQNLSPDEGEESVLAARRTELMAAEKITEDLNAAAAAFDEGNIETKLSVALRSIERAAARLPQDGTGLEAASTRLDAALAEASEARVAIDNAMQAFGADQDELDSVEERLFALRAEARKHGVTPDELSSFMKKIQDALGNLEQGEAAFSDLEGQLIKTKKAFHSAAARLSKARKAAAKKLDVAVAKELAPLKLGKAVFATHIETSADTPASEGIDSVEFMVATNPGAPAGPLKTIASGGELSRFVLAMKAALAAKENRTVIIFDEVDAGVGGAVADAVGERLARLANEAQVLVVTHSPQVAARARHHWQVSKTQTKTDTKTAVDILDTAARVEEIARMLSGAEVTAEARAAARALLGVDKGKTPARKKLAKAR